MKKHIIPGLFIAIFSASLAFNVTTMASHFGDKIDLGLKSAAQTKLVDVIPDEYETIKTDVAKLGLRDEMAKLEKSMADYANALEVVKNANSNLENSINEFNKAAYEKIDVDSRNAGTAAMVGTKISMPTLTRFQMELDSLYEYSAQSMDRNMSYLEEFNKKIESVDSTGLGEIVMKYGIYNEWANLQFDLVKLNTISDYQSSNIKSLKDSAIQAVKVLEKMDLTESEREIVGEVIGSLVSNLKQSSEGINKFNKANFETIQNLITVFETYETEEKGAF